MDLVCSRKIWVRYKMTENIINRNLSYAYLDDDAECRYREYKNKDPFPNIAPALLNSADIADYVSKTGMICPFDPSRLGPASYEMVLGGEYLYWDEDGNKTSCERIQEGEEITILKNSITYISVKESLRIPNYIALRFNFRVKYVHRGLLLGTGPLIDPGFQGKLMIPIHNLTNNQYTLKAGKDIISVEFTKISTNSKWEMPITSEHERIGQYVENSLKNSNKRFENLLKNSLPFGTGKVMSSLAGTLAEARKQIYVFSNYKNIAIGAGIIGTIALIALVMTTVGVITDANKYVSDAAMMVKKNQQEDLDIRNLVSRNEIDPIKITLDNLQEKLNKLELSKISIDKFAVLATRNDLDELKKQVNILKEEIERFRKDQKTSNESKK